MKRFKEYIECVKSGEIVTGNLIKLAIERHLKDLKNSDLYFDEAKAAKAIKLIEFIRHWKGKEFAGNKLILEPFQVFYFASIFGWTIKATGLRRFKQSYLEMARKNGKTSMAAGGGIVHIVLDKEPGAQVYFVATKEEQARIGFEDTQKFIKQTPELAPHFSHFAKSTTHKMSSIKPLGSNSKAQDGFDPSWGIVDEYHAHNTDGMLNILESGMGARQQPMINIITTAGFDQYSACYNLRKVCVDILEGRLTDDSLFIMIYSLDEGDDWKDENNWIKANPNLNVSISKDFIRGRILQAMNEGGSKEVDVKTKNLNIWTDSSTAWIPHEIMINNFATLNRADLAGKECVAGLDLAKGVDLNAFVLYFPQGGEVLPFFWIPSEKLKANRDRVDYSLWKQKGYIETTEGNIIDQKQIKNKIIELSKEFKIRSIAFDRYLAYTGFIQDLTNDGYVDSFPIGQGFLSLSEPSKQLEKLLYGGKLKIESPVLKWMFGNTIMVRDDAGNIKPSKGKSEKKIDGVVALIMAVAESMRFAITDNEKSIFDEDIDWTKI